MEREVKPQPGPQTAFLQTTADVAFYGGAAGGGKSYALLLDPLYDYHDPGFGAVIFRRTTKQVMAEGGLWDTALDLYCGIGGKPNLNGPNFTFPGGSRIGFAHLEHEKNRFDWQGAQIPFIGFDELTHFTWKQFNYLQGRNRSLCSARSRIRGTCNPDPDSWVRRFIDWYIGPDGLAIPERSGVIRYFVIENDVVVWGDTRAELLAGDPERLPKSFTFISAKLSDNKILMDKDPSYLASLQAQTRVERARLLGGNWNIRPTAGLFFRRSDFQLVDAAPAEAERVRGWDQAGTKDGGDWSAGVRMSRTPAGAFYIEHCERFQSNPSAVDSRIKNTAQLDGRAVRVRLAQDPGQAGKSQAASQTRMLAGFDVTARPVTGDKMTRARPLAAQVEAGNVFIVRGRWNDDFLAEHESFPDGTFDDQVDAAADAFDELANGGDEPSIRTL